MECICVFLLKYYAWTSLHRLSPWNRERISTDEIHSKSWESLSVSSDFSLIKTSCCKISFSCLLWYQLYELLVCVFSFSSLAVISCNVPLIRKCSNLYFRGCSEFINAWKKLLFKVMCTIGIISPPLNYVVYMYWQNSSRNSPLLLLQL